MINYNTIRSKMLGNHSNLNNDNASNNLVKSSDKLDYDKYFWKLYQHFNLYNGFDNASRYVIFKHPLKKYAIEVWADQSTGYITLVFGPNYYQYSIYDVNASRPEELKYYPLTIKINNTTQVKKFTNFILALLLKYEFPLNDKTKIEYDEF